MNLLCYVFSRERITFLEVPKSLEIGTETGLSVGFGLNIYVGRRGKYRIKKLVKKVLILNVSVIK